MLDMPVDLLLGAKLSIFGRRFGRNMAIYARRQHGHQVRRLEHQDVERMAAVRVSNGDIAGKVTEIKKQPGPDLHVWEVESPANAYQA